MTFEKYLLDNDFLSQEGLEHAQEIMNNSSVGVNQRFRTLENTLILLSSFNETHMVNLINSYEGKTKYISTENYQIRVELFKILPLTELMNLETVVLGLDPALRKIELGTISKLENNLIRVKTLISKAFPSYTIKVHNILEIPFMKWVQQGHILNKQQFDPQEIKISVDEVMKTIFRMAVEKGATDISIESQQRYTSVFFTIDKIRREFKNKRFTPKESSELSNWILTTGGVPQLHIESKFNDCALPSLGRVMTHRGRVSKISTNFGICYNIRILPNDPKFIDISTLGYTPNMQKYLHFLSIDRKGLVIVGGPTNSGKNTTVFAILTVMIKKYNKKFISLEDPVEYVVPGVNQVNATTKEEYEGSARALVRQSPDILYLSEIRDDITIDTATNISNQGKLVFSTLHFSHAYQVFNRTRDLAGVDNSSVLSTELIGVINQVLVPKSCPHCLEAVKKSEIEPIYTTVLDSKTYVGPIYRNTGKSADGKTNCLHCDGDGYKGIIPVAEYINFDAQLKRELRKVNTLPEKEEILQSRMQQTNNSLLDNGLEHMMNGNVSIDTLIETSILDVEFKED